MVLALPSTLRQLVGFLADGFSTETRPGSAVLKCARRVGLFFLRSFCKYGAEGCLFSIGSRREDGPTRLGEARQGVLAMPGIDPITSDPHSRHQSAAVGESSLPEPAPSRRSVVSRVRRSSRDKLAG
jgi:hypothetical protein